MTKLSRILTTAAFALCALPGWANDFAPGWTLDREASNIRFQSVKNSTVVESSTFATYSGAIGEDGTAELKIKLESVDTKVDLRNVRMRFLFFETFRYPEATVTAQLSPDMIGDLKQVRRKTITLPFSLDLHGIKKTLVTEVVATLLSDDRVSIATTAPISIAAADFDLSENIGKLEEAAGVTIIPSATVTFDFLFDRSGAGAAPSGGGTTETDPEVVNVALEPEGNLDLEACEGRFEILSRTGNIYFRSGSARLDTESRPLLTEVVDIATRCPQLDIEIAGHTDSDGPASANERLSEARARSVADFLINAGVPRDRLTARGYGEARPVADNSTRDGKSRNRRIEFLSQAN